MSLTNLLKNIDHVLEFMVNIDPNQKSTDLNKQLMQIKQNAIKNKTLLARQDKARMLIQQKNIAFQRGITAEQKREAMNPLLRRAQPLGSIVQPQPTMKPNPLQTRKK
jgi:uncharacterized membrane protein YgaE (UPF0421/DUF939 family)